MCHRLTILLVALMAIASAEDITIADIVRLDDAKPHPGHVQLAGQAMPFTFESTSKGNGTLTIANLALRVMDSHDDGAVFDHKFLTVQVVDLDGKGPSGLLVTGTALLTGEQGPPTSTPVPISCLYRWDGAAGAFAAVAEVGGQYVRPGDIPTPEARQAAFDRALTDLCHAPHATALEAAKAALLAAAKGHPEVLTPHLRRFTSYYTGAVPDAGPERADPVSARAVMWVAGTCGFATDIAPLLVDKSLPCVVYAYAEARGIRLYSFLTEDAGFDQIVPPDRAREILRVNNLLPTAKP